MDPRDRSRRSPPYRAALHRGQKVASILHILPGKVPTETRAYPPASPAANPCSAGEAPTRVRDTLTVSSSCSPPGPQALGRPAPSQPPSACRPRGTWAPRRPSARAEARGPRPGQAPSGDGARATRTHTHTRTPAHTLARTSSLLLARHTHTLTHSQTHTLQARETRK